MSCRSWWAAFLSLSTSAPVHPDSSTRPRMAMPTELRVDALYRNTQDWKNPKDEFNRFFRFGEGGINNVSGFRPKGRVNGSGKILDCAFCLLTTTFGQQEWPDEFDP